FVVSTDPSIKMTQELSAKVDYNRFYRGELKEGMMVHVGHWMQMVPARIEAASGKDAEVKMAFDGKIIHKPGDLAVVMYLEGGKLRVVGTVILP
ncbi:MAG: translation elongation factor 1 alpha-related protein, partial [Methanomethylophilus sp.]